MNKKGFTLIELLIVVSIIGILAMIAVPSFVGQGRKAARTEASTNLQNLRMLLEQKFADGGSYAPPNYCLKNAAGAPAIPATAVPAVSPLTYAATIANNSSQLEDYFCGFNPAGLDNATQLADLTYTYTLAFTATTFTATADAKDDSRVGGDADCTIDQNNTRVGPCW